MTPAPATRLDGTSLETVQRAVEQADPLVGTREGHEGCRGFAGVLSNPDGNPTYVRDVLGRFPLFVEREDPWTWSFDRPDLDEPRAIPPGHVATPDPDSDHLLADGVWSLPHHCGSDAGRTEDYWAGRTELSDLDVAGEAVHDALGASLDSVRAETGTVAVAFSGGVDSALLAAELDAPCYVAGFPDSHDVEAAETAADAMDADLDLRVVEVTHEAIERAVPAVSRATGRTNAMDVAIALPLSLVAERAAADGIDRLVVGQGADELFGGYEKLLDPADDHRVEAETVHGAVRETLLGLPDQLERDVLTLRAAGVEPVAPFLDDRVVDVALSLAPDLLVDSETGTRKVALRAAAARTLPESVATREKKAVQYGTNVSRELDRLARQAGFKRRMDDHVGQYVRSLR